MEGCDDTTPRRPSHFTARTADAAARHEKEGTDAALARWMDERHIHQTEIEMVDAVKREGAKWTEASEVIMRHKENSRTSSGGK